MSNNSPSDSSVVAEIINIEPDCGNSVAIASLGDDKKSVYEFLLYNPDVYNSVFFPKTFRQRSAPFHRDMEAALRAKNRFLGFKVFRDGAKTTRLRALCAYRLSYGLCRTILYVSSTLENAKRSLAWLRVNVESNRAWADFYGLTLGSKWSATELEINVKELGIRVNVLAVGIQGQIRGINIDDYRPDLIVCDDPDDEDSTNTPELCKKQCELFFGTLENTLAPASENPLAQLILLQTPLKWGDIIDTAGKDPRYIIKEYGILDENNQSRWETRWPTAQVLTDKQAAIDRGMLSTWMREKECTIVSDSAIGLPKKFITLNELPPNIIPKKIRIGVDPASSETLAADNFAVIAVVEDINSRIFALPGRSIKSEDQDEHILAIVQSYDFCVSLFPHCHDIAVVVEAISYQRTLSRALHNYFARQARFVSVRAIKERGRKKNDRILQELCYPLNKDCIYVILPNAKLIGQLQGFPSLRHDDELDALATAVESLDWNYHEDATKIQTAVERVFTSSGAATSGNHPNISNHLSKLVKLIGRTRA